MALNRRAKRPIFYRAYAPKISSFFGGAQHRQKRRNFLSDKTKKNRYFRCPGAAPGWFLPVLRSKTDKNARKAAVLSDFPPSVLPVCVTYEMALDPPSGRSFYDKGMRAIGNERGHWDGTGRLWNGTMDEGTGKVLTNPQMIAPRA